MWHSVQKVRLSILSATLSLFALIALYSHQPSADAEDVDYGDIVINRFQQRFSGDLDAMRKRRFIRVLVNYNKTNFFYDKAGIRGFEFEILKEFEKHLNRNIKGTLNKTQLIFIPMPFNALIPALLAGKGEMIAAGMTITPSRKKYLAFSRPYISDISELIVTSKNVKNIHKIDDLAGKSVHVLNGSSYVQNLYKLNRQFEKRGLDSIEIVEADKRLETEDLLELVHAGAIELTISDSHRAELWAHVLPDLRVRKDLGIHSGGEIAWAVQPGNDKLLAEINGFVKKSRKGTLIGNILFKRYYESKKWVNNPMAKKDLQRFNSYSDMFRKFAGDYDLDWLALISQGYQESGLDQSVKSSAGAIGIMQLLPSTAKSPEVNIADIHLAKKNIQAGSKYMRFLIDNYFNDPKMDPTARFDFALAAYNAGPNRIQRLRKKAASLGYDANKWFGHVERVVLRAVGRQPVDYVANINKYFITYRLSLDLVNGK